MSQKIDEYWNLRPARFRYLESVELHRVVGGACAEPYSMSLTLLEEPQAFSERARFKFFGVRDIKISSLDGLLGLVFEIRDEAHRQLEDVRFRVIESEQHAFAFWCRDFEFKILPSVADS